MMIPVVVRDLTIGLHPTSPLGPTTLTARGTTAQPNPSSSPVYPCFIAAIYIVISLSSTTDSGLQ